MFITSDIYAQDIGGTQPMRIAEGSRLVARLLSRVLGTGFLIAAVGLWLVPGSNFAADLMLFKLCLSVCALGAGAGFIQLGARPAAPEVQIDMAQRRIRVLRPSVTGSMKVLQQCCFDELSHVERGGPHLRLWDRDGAFLAEVTLTRPEEMERVLDHLRAAQRAG
jgi:hypothetical protein